MSAKPECPADPSTQITSWATSPDKHSQRSNALCPSIFHLVRHNNLTDVSPLSTSVRLWQAAVYKMGVTVEEFPAAVLHQSNLFQKNFKNIYRAGEQSISISCLFHTCADSRGHCVLGLRLMQVNSNGFSSAHLKLSIKQWQIGRHDTHWTEDGKLLLTTGQHRRRR